MSKKGEKLSSEHRAKLSIAHTGKRYGKRSEAVRKNISESLKGKKNPGFGKPAWNAGKKLPQDHPARKKMCEKKLGTHRTEETKKKISLAFTGKKHPMYIDGRSMHKRGGTWRSIKKKILNRDGFMCQEIDCGRKKENNLVGGKPRELDVHHIDGDGKNHFLENLITLCLLHHPKIGKMTAEAAPRFKKILSKKKWDERFMILARHVAQWSRDPSTKVGAVLVGNDRREIAMGYNGFPPGIEDTQERLANRPVKYKLIQHAERNVLDNCRFDSKGSTLYVTFHPCSECAKSIVSRGIARVVAPVPVDPREPWKSEIEWARLILEEAGVKLDPS